MIRYSTIPQTQSTIKTSIAAGTAPDKIMLLFVIPIPRSDSINESSASTMPVYKNRYPIMGSLNRTNHSGRVLFSEHKGTVLLCCFCVDLTPPHAKWTKGDRVPRRERKKSRTGIYYVMVRGISRNGEALFRIVHNLYKSEYLKR